MNNEADKGEEDERLRQRIVEAIAKAGRSQLVALLHTLESTNTSSNGKSFQMTMSPMKSETSRKRKRYENPESNNIGGDKRIRLDVQAFLPENILQYTFGFVGEGSFLNMALVSKRFRNSYLSFTKLSTNTTDAVTLSCVWLTQRAIEEKHFVEPERPTSSSPLLCTRIAESGNLDVLAWARKTKFGWDDNTARALIQRGCYTMMRWARKYNIPSPFRANEFQNCKVAAQRGRVDALFWLRSSTPPSPWDEECCKWAAFYGRVKTMTWLRAQNPPCPWNEKVCWFSLYGGHYSMLKWLRSQDPPCPYDDQTITEAARKGQWKIVQWLRSQDPPCPWSDWTTRETAEHGQLPMLKWLRSQDPPCPWETSTCTAAASTGRLNILIWARSRNPPCPWSARVCSKAAEGGWLGVLIWLRSQNPPCPWNQDTLNEAASNGRADVLRWALASGCPCTPTEREGYRQWLLENTE